MTVQVSVFAGLSDYFAREQALQLPEASTIKDLFETMKNLNPEAGTLLASCRAAVNEELVSHDRLLQPADQIYLFPPSSGG